MIPPLLIKLLKRSFQENKPRQLSFRLPDRKAVNSYELKVLSGSLIKYALPITIQETSQDLILTLDLLDRSQSLWALDLNKQRNQELGLERIIQILAYFIDAQERLLRPTWSYVSLETIFLADYGYRFPLLPLAEGEAVCLDTNSFRLGFWQEWADFYRVQAELASLGQHLSQQGDFKALMKVYQNYLRQYRLAKRKLPKENPSQRGFSIEADTGSTRLAELYLMPCDSSFRPRKRLALLADQEFVLGRDPGFSDLCFQDPCLGRRHAKISKEKGHFFIEDLASLNGTYVDGRRLQRNECLLLALEAEIKMGNIRLIFRQLGPQRSQQANSYFVPNNLSPASPRPGTIYL